MLLLTAQQLIHEALNNSGPNALLNLVWTLAPLAVTDGPRLKRLRSGLRALAYAWAHEPEAVDLSPDLLPEDNLQKFARLMILGSFRKFCDESHLIEHLPDAMAMMAWAVDSIQSAFNDNATLLAQDPYVVTRPPLEAPEEDVQRYAMLVTIADTLREQEKTLF